MLHLRKPMTYLLLVPLLGFIALTGLAQTSIVPVSSPVHGRYVFPGFVSSQNPPASPNQLFLIDTFTGEWELLSEISRLVASPAWSPDGQRVVYLNGVNTNTIIDITSGIVEEQTISGRNSAFYPGGWSADGNVILYRSFDFAIPITQYTVDMFDINTQTMSTILYFTVGEVLNNVPAPTLPPGVNQLAFKELLQANLNPIYDEWMVLQIATSVPADIAVSEDTAIPWANVVYNRDTGQMLSLNQLFGNGDEISTAPMVWSPDGTRLILRFTNIDNISRNGIVELHNVDGNWSLELTKNAEGPFVVDWLGVSDLLLIQTSDGSDDRVFEIGQIINNLWYSSELFRIPSSTIPGVGVGDWYLNAAADERHTLSCLFDQSLVTRLAVGARARVAFTGGKPASLRSAPELRSTEIQQMPEGTEFDVIGGPACDEGFRWWQVQLADNTQGWAAEADNATHFLELVPPATPTPTPTNMVEWPVSMYVLDQNDHPLASWELTNYVFVLYANDPYVAPNCILIGNSIDQAQCDYTASR